MKEEVTNHVPVNHEPILKYDVGNNSNPDQPMNINLSRFNQSSINWRYEDRIDTESLNLRE